jgi:hypothetical protein
MTINHALRCNLGGSPGGGPPGAGGPPGGGGPAALAPAPQQVVIPAGDA